MAERHETLRGPVYQRLFGVLIQRSRYPVGFQGWDTSDIDEDEFDRYRLYAAAELIPQCASIPGNKLWVIQGLTELLNKPGASWEEFEASFFAMSCLAPAFREGSPEEHGALASLIGSDKVLGGSVESRHPLVLIAIAKLVQAFAEWFVKASPQLLQAAMLFCLNALTSAEVRHAPVAVAVAKAFSSLGVRAAKLLGTEQSIGEIVRRLIPGALDALDLEARVLIIESLGRLSVLLPRSQCQTVVETIVQPNLERINALAAAIVPGTNLEASAGAVVTEFRLLCGVVRFLEFPVSETAAVKEVHPNLVVLQNVMAPIRHLAGVFQGHPGVADAICDLFRRALQAARESLSDLLSSIMEIIVPLFQAGKYPECLDVCGVAVEVFGGNPSSTNDFAVLVSTLSNDVFAAAHHDLGSRPDMLSSYFDLLGRLVIFNPNAILLQPGVFGVVCELSGVVLSLSNRDVLRSLLVFLAHVSSHLSAATAIGDAVRNKMGTSGLAIVKAGLLAASDTMPVELVPRLTDTLHALVKLAPNEVAQCAVEVLNMPHLQKGQFTDEDRHRFCSLVLDQDLLSKPRRYKSMMSDFAKVCQNQGTADSLLAYLL